ncbi:MAG: hypothetical protein WEB53_17015, partial [Akkermansiaceae bacterium]
MHPERLAFPFREHKAPIHHPRNAVVNHRFRSRILPISQPPSLAHAGTLPPQVQMPRRILIIYPSPNNVLFGFAGTVGVLLLMIPLR